jgi:hypothetical protein
MLTKFHHAAPMYSVMVRGSGDRVAVFAHAGETHFGLLLASIPLFPQMSDPRRRGDAARQI